MFGDKFLDSLPDNPVKAAHTLCGAFIEFEAAVRWQDREESYDDFAEGYAAIEAFVLAHALPVDLPELGGNKASDLDEMCAFVRGVYGRLDQQLADATLSIAREKFRGRFGLLFAYSFSDGDLKRLQQLINELRDLVVTSELFDAEHKDRILKRIEALQRELHKKMSNLDRFWGLIGDAGVALGKFGNDAKPFVDRVREIAEIVWRTQARAEELPSGTPLTLLTKGQDQER